MQMTVLTPLDALCWHIAATGRAMGSTPVDSVALVGLTMAACVTRLWRLHHPATPVYDETHVGRFLGWYHERAFFFDVVRAARLDHTERTGPPPLTRSSPTARSTGHSPSS